MENEFETLIETVNSRVRNGGHYRGFEYIYDFIKFRQGHNYNYLQEFNILGKKTDSVQKNISERIGNHF